MKEKGGGILEERGFLRGMTSYLAVGEESSLKAGTYLLYPGRCVEHPPRPRLPTRYVPFDASTVWYMTLTIEYSFAHNRRMPGTCGIFLCRLMSEQPKWQGMHGLRNSQLRNGGMQAGHPIVGADVSPTYQHGCFEEGAVLFTKLGTRCCAILTTPQSPDRVPIV